MTRHLLPDRIVAQRSMQSPSAVAVIEGSRRISYGELEADARRMANFLRGRGIGAGSTVGLYPASGAQLVVSLLGIGKSGAALVLLPRDTPADRLDRIVRDARVDVLLTGGTDIAAAENSGVDVLCLDTAWEKDRALPGRCRRSTRMRRRPPPSSATERATSAWWSTAAPWPTTRHRSWDTTAWPTPTGWCTAATSTRPPATGRCWPPS
ncbi:hypothetical protein GCM10020000_12880 [Streptomyces olivoverticillatus]